MAKNDAAAPAAAELTNDQVAKLIKAEVVVPVLDKEGKRVCSKDPNDGSLVYRNEKVPAKGEHIHSFRVAGGKVIALTIDGKKYEAALA